MSKFQYSKIHAHIIEKIKEARFDADLTQVELAKKLKLHQGAISKLERMDRMINAVELALIADALNKPIKYFYP